MNKKDLHKVPQKQMSINNKTKLEKNKENKKANSRKSKKVKKIKITQFLRNNIQAAKNKKFI